MELEILATLLSRRRSFEMGKINTSIVRGYALFREAKNY